MHVLESEPAIGGFFALLDRQFPTNSCGVCFMSPKPPAYCPIYESEFHENIDLVTNVSLKAAEGEAGDFRISFEERPRHVDVDKCTLCGKCTDVCPVEVEDALGGGIEKRKAIYLPFAQAIPRSYVVDKSACTKCGKCVGVCKPGAIDLEERPRERQIGAGAIVLGFGFEPFRGECKGEYGLGRYRNVVSSIQYERMLSFSGPTGGVPGRPSDGNRPRKVAFIQCVGSRDPSCGQGYCSSICCMYATKQAMMTKDRDNGVDAAILYMDVRTVGKGYERYYERAKGEYGIRYVRSAVSSVKELQRSKRLRIAYGDDAGELREEDFDMVVLSIGFRAPEGVKAAAGVFGVELNEYDFCRSAEFCPTETSVPGIYVAGAFREPRDIPETVVDASAAAAAVSEFLDEFKRAGEGSDSCMKEGEPARGEEEELRIGVFLCDSKGTLGEGLDVEELRETIVGLGADVVCVERVDVTSVKDGSARITAKVEEQALNRVLIAGHRGLALTKALKRECAAISKGECVLESANIGEQCVDVHSENRVAATAKAKSLVRAGVGKARQSERRAVGRKQVSPRVVVIGGGVSGMASSLSLAEQGMDVTLVEKADELGGNAAKAHYTLKGSDVPAMMKGLISKVESHPGIDVLKGSALEALEGTWGSFRLRIAESQSRAKALGSSGDEMRNPQSEIECGAVIFATGAQEAMPEEYLYGQDERVVTQRQLEEMLSKCESGNAGRGTEKESREPKIRNLRSVVMIQCVGSRDEKRPYCSRVCCGHAVKNMLKLKALNPDAQVYVLYRDMRTYGFYEKYYHEAREKGVVFVRYDPEHKPQVTSVGGHVSVAFLDEVAGQQMRVEADFLVLSNGLKPNDDSKELAETGGLQLTEDGFFAEANPKSAPLDSVDRGKYICGLCNAPNHIDDAICQGKAAAARASALLWQGFGEYAENQAYVVERRCSGCGLCVSACPYGARELDEASGTARVLEDLCKGCGTCVISCPNGASRQYNFEREGILGVLDEVLV